jgi:cell division protein ZapA (FtsZ GTPase activity inhibitor)
MSEAPSEPIRRTYALRILGRPISIQSSSGDDHVDTVASMVAERMGEIRERARTADAVDVAILAALNLADECLRARARLTEERGRVTDWANVMRARVIERA